MRLEWRIHQSRKCGRALYYGHTVGKKTKNVWAVCIKVCSVTGHTWPAVKIFIVRMHSHLYYDWSPNLCAKMFHLKIFTISIFLVVGWKWSSKDGHMSKTPHTSNKPISVSSGGGHLLPPETQLQLMRVSHTRTGGAPWPPKKIQKQTFCPPPTL